MEGLTFEKFFIKYCEKLEKNGIDPDDFIESEKEIMKLYMSQAVIREWDNEQAKQRKKQRAEQERLQSRVMMKTLENMVNQTEDGGLKESLRNLTNTIFKKDKKLM